MTDVIVGYARRPTPRYTSYPTAPHFRPDFSPGAYAQWLAELDISAPVSLYAHTPFCASMCWYCACNMKLSARYGPVADYVDALLAEIALVAAATPKGVRASRLHFGGGTPNALAPRDLARIVCAFDASFPFVSGAERAIEIDPRSLTEDMIDMIGALGFTRASFGVQEFDPQVQAAINRRQPAEMVEGALTALRGAGVGAFSFDLIYGLPHQTEAMLLATVERCVAMQPDRISLFGYAHVPWAAKNQRMIDEAALPTSEERAAQASGARDALISAGYEAIGIDHFALPHDSLARAARAGALKRNFQGYTDDAAPALIGFGATAIGRLPQGYVQNIAETGAWARAISEGRLPVARGLAFTAEDQLRGAVIEKIMCDGCVDLEAMGRRFGAQHRWWAPEADTLAAFARDGLVAVSEGRVALTQTGLPLARVVAAVFDAYLPAQADGARRHSIAL